MIGDELKQRMAQCLASGTGITFLTGAGISAESGIPTFRGPEGYWTVGSRVYQPQEMATWRMFQQNPDAVWQWYLYRAGVCRRAAPNPGHLALAALEPLLGERFRLITQNVDGLHLRAGNTPARTYQIHGNVFFMRCAAECTAALIPLPASLAGRDATLPLDADVRRQLTCGLCGGPTRPHVLWFDESYDEPHFRFHSSLQTAAATGMLWIVGTSGSTNLPLQVAAEVARRGGTLVDVNPAANPFSQLARRTPGGAFVPQTAARFLPAMLAVFKELLADPTTAP